MTRAVFETAALSDAVKRAARVAPRQGAALHACAGLYLEIRDEKTVRIRATDQDTFYDVWVNLAEFEGEPADWRVPSNRFSTWLSQLPSGAGQTVEFRDDLAMPAGTGAEPRHGWLTGQQKSSKVGFLMLDSRDFPAWDTLSEENCSTVSMLGEKISQVSWACGNASPLDGVTFDGQHLIACDRFRVARVACEMELDHPITVPPRLLAELSKEMGEVLAGDVDGRFVVAPDEYTQIRSLVYAQTPPLTTLRTMMVTDYEHEVNLSKELVQQAITRMIGGGTEGEVLRMIVAFGDGHARFEMHDKTGLGAAHEAIDVSTADHELVKFAINPKYLTDALGRSPGESVTLRYDTVQNKKKPRIMVDSGSDYKVWIMEMAGGQGA